MKKIFLSIATMLMMGTGVFAANNDNVNQQAIRSFKKDFASASNIVWEQKEGFAKATFSLNGQVLFAYYDNNGDLTVALIDDTSDRGRYVHGRLFSLQRDQRTVDLDGVAGLDEHVYDGHVLEIAHVGHSHFYDASHFGISI